MYSMKELTHMAKSETKEKVVRAASTLFYQKGFHGTSVRDIAKKASVNVSLISYYFKGKQGLLEYTVINYYESYMKTIADCLESVIHLEPLEQLKQLIFSIIQYKQENQQLSCFIHRELSVDSIFVREIAVTYVAKENYYLKELFNASLQSSKADKQYLMMQLKGMIVAPYVLQNEFKNRLLDHYSKKIFVKRYVQTIYNWLDCVTSP